MGRVDPHYVCDVCGCSGKPGTRDGHYMGHGQNEQIESTPTGWRWWQTANVRLLVCTQLACVQAGLQAEKAYQHWREARKKARRKVIKDIEDHVRTQMTVWEQTNPAPTWTAP